MMRGLGKGLHEFKKGTKDVTDPLKTVKEDIISPVVGFDGNTPSIGWRLVMVGVGREAYCRQCNHLRKRWFHQFGRHQPFGFQYRAFEVPDDKARLV